MKNWKKEGLSWAIWMIIMMEFVKPLILGDPLSIKTILIGIPFYLFAGFFMTFVMKYLFFRKNKD